VFTHGPLVLGKNIMFKKCSHLFVEKPKKAKVFLVLRKPMSTYVLLK
jgi:hypothetical protein